MFVSRLPSANNPKAPIIMLDTSRIFQKVWEFSLFTRKNYSSAGIIPSRARVSYSSINIQLFLLTCERFLYYFQDLFYLEPFHPNLSLLHKP